jgi:hypothetical protein
MEFCNEYFPENPQAAFDMYKHTFAFITAIYYNQGEKYLHHGGLERPRGKPVPLKKVMDAYAKMKKLIDRISDENQYKKDLQKYGLIISYLGRIAAGDKSIVDSWRKLDRDSFDELAASNFDKWYRL